MKTFTVTFIVKGYEASNTQTIQAKDKANAEEIVKESLEVMYKLNNNSVEIISVEEK
jgi:hypothetical protein